MTPTATPAEPPTRPPRAGRARRSPEARAEAAEQRRMEHDLRHAVAQDALVLLYQPIRALRSETVTGAEALIRWPHRRRGLLSAAAFLPLAERSDLITEIGGWTLAHACREAANWPAPADGFAPVVSVNIAARQLHNGALLAQVATALDASALPPERLQLELSEAMLLDVDSDMLLSLSAIADLGVGLALDYFGAGYASLAMLKRLPLTALKLDRALIRDLPDQPEDAAIARAVIDTGHAIGLVVVAEGIETERQRDYLAAIGCDEGQGHLFAQPLTPAQLMRLLRS